MTEPQSIEEFEHFHKDAMVRLENEQFKLDEMFTPPGLEPVDTELRQTLRTIRQGMPRSGRLDPDEIFQKAISSLSAVDAQRFLMDNFLEALKRGDPLPALTERFRTLGLDDDFISF